MKPDPRPPVHYCRISDWQVPTVGYKQSPTVQSVPGYTSTTPRLHHEGVVLLLLPATPLLELQLEQGVGRDVVEGQRVRVLRQGFIRQSSQMKVILTL